MNCVPNNFLRVLSRHADCTTRKLSRASGLSREEIEFSTDPEVISIRSMVNSVLSEGHMMKSFVRLRPFGERVLYGYMKPTHDVWNTVGYFFAKRFPNTLILLGNNCNSHVFLYLGNEMNHVKAGPLTQALKDLKAAMGNNRLESPDELWKTYYWSQYRPEAKNTRYFKQNVRAKHAKAAGMEIETDSGGSRLEDFFAIS